MKTIGLLGGMSWESTVTYYRILNETVKAKLGGLHSAQCVMWSVDFAEIEELQHLGKWGDVATLLSQAAQSIERAGADFLVICTNTMHKLADEIQESVQIPILHIADATAEKILTKGLKRVGLLGTRFTMEEGFYRGRLIERFGLDVVIPPADEREIVHRVIYEELCLGDVRESSRKRYRTTIQRLVSEGAEGIILGCTEIGLLVGEGDSPVPLFDTAKIHAEEAVEWALEGVKP
jgi:aspartate racemase